MVCCRSSTVISLWTYIYTYTYMYTCMWSLFLHIYKYIYTYTGKRSGSSGKRCAVARQLRSLQSPGVGYPCPPASRRTHSRQSHSWRGRLCDQSWGVLQCVVLCCSVLQCVAVCCILGNRTVGAGASAISLEVCCSALQCVAVCCSALQCVAVRCSLLQCVAF